MTKLEFLLCGSPSDAFWSQLAMFRLSLDSLGPVFCAARVVLVLADLEHVPVPARWRRWLRGVDIEWAPVESFLEWGDGEDHLFTLLDPTADLSFICDADTLFVRPIPADMLERMVAEPAIYGVIAHVPAPKKDDRGTDLRHLDNDAFWSELAQRVLGRDIDLPFHYTLNASLGRCPFYINYGFVAAPPRLLQQLHEHMAIVVPKIRNWLDNDFFAQLGIALAVEQGGIPIRVLPMRYNFPNDARFDAAYPEEVEHAILIHYLRLHRFDRHRIFAESEEFNRFMQLELEGSNRVFQEYVRQLTDGYYPFAGNPPAMPRRWFPSLRSR
jgi:hypothetical protein